jgi:hypothetical protein
VRGLRDHGLSLVFGTIFVLALVGESIAGLALYNNDQLSTGGEPVSFVQYVTSSSFAADVAENWQSEYLQFFLYIFLTVWLVQRGSSESKPLDKIGPESDEDQRIGRHATNDSPRWAKSEGWRTTIYSSSLGLVMGVIFLGSWLAQSIAGRASYNAQQLAAFSDPVSWPGYVTSADFWNRTLQNWQSEFLAVASMVILSVYLRQRGSPESKPVGAPHQTTGAEG